VVIVEDNGIVEFWVLVDEVDELLDSGEFG